MDATLTLIDLAGAVALLLWGVHMVQSGIQRAFGPNLRRVLSRALGGRWRAFLAGLGITAILQSSTATGLMASSFAASGLVELAPGLAVMLGANVGTTLIVQVLSFDIGRVAPLFVLVGVILFRKSGQSRTRDLGRVAIGLGLMLIALQQLLSVIAPYEDVPSLRMLMGAIATQPIIDVILAAALTWAAHSSVATVLLIVSFAAKGVIPPHAAFALVLGANLGTALNPLLEAAPNGDPVAKRLPVGNLLNRAIGCAVCLGLLNWIGPLMVQVEPDAARAVADFHTLFNLVTALVFLPVLGPFARMLVRLLPARAGAVDPSQPLYLDDTAREMPAMALAGAAREALRMADVTEAMLRSALEALDRGDRNQVAATKGLDNVLDRLNTAIKVYLTALDPDALDDEDNRRLAEILAFATNLEHAGDIVEKSLMSIAAKRLKRGLAFSVEGQAEIREMLERLAGNAQSAAAVFMTQDARAARRLLGEKEVFRDLETRATEAHFARIRAGRTESVETSALHLDVLRDLKRINAHLSAAAYPVLEYRGELLPSRLRQDAEEEAR
ncbi:MAG TPA: Na/Pi cotransporter family protein [Stellaceae bacterium]|jgi:phosphate:Na+ symporter|nr:Na/Pi cotransporter family protein [Stellaceae bacterium]